MNNNEKDFRIKQLIPVPNEKTPLMYSPDIKCFSDESGSMFYALMENQKDEEVRFYWIDCLGCGCILGLCEVILEDTVHCKKCGQRMKIQDVPFEDYDGGLINADITYRCRCGMKYHKNALSTIEHDEGAWEE